MCDLEEPPTARSALALSRMAGELGELHVVSKRLEETLGSLSGRDHSMTQLEMECFQSLDRLTQELEGLAAFAQGLAVGNGENSVSDALAMVRLQSLRDRLSERPAPADEAGVPELF